MSPFSGIAASDPVAPAKTPSDWAARKAEILARLDLVAEYEALGVRFTRRVPDTKGRLECHSIERPDESPSAVVFAKSGRYHDSGSATPSLGFWDFALKHGNFGEYADVLRHYTAKAGLDVRLVKSRNRVPEAHYDYRDESGAVRYRVFRYVLPNGKKTFTQHPPDGRGGWKYGAGCMDGVAPLPYRLPELLASDPSDPVFIVEGEKAAEALVAHGLVATTNHGGSKVARKTWPHFLDHFRGRECLVLPDNDATGRAHAREVRGHLRGVAASVRLVELPGLPPKGDVVDWLAEGGTVEELGRLAHAAPEWTPGEGDGVEAGTRRQGGDDPDRDATVADLRHKLSAEAWLWPGWIPQGALTLLASDPGVGKTRFCFDLHRRLHNGLPWPNGAPMPMLEEPRILWVVADDQYREMCDIPEAFGIPDDCIYVNATAGDPFGGTTLQTPEELADLEARIERVRPTLVVIDTITNTSDAKSQDSSDAKKQYKPLQGIATRCQVPILCVTHLNVGGKVLGRRAVEKVRVVIQLEQPDPEGQEHRRKLWVSKSKALKPPALGITMGDSGNEYDTSPPEKPEDGRVEGHKKGPVPTKLKECMDWLKTKVNCVPVRVAKLRGDAEAEGFDAKVLYRAKEQLGIVETETEPGGAIGRRYKQWSRPPDGPPF